MKTPEIMIIKFKMKGKDDGGSRDGGQVRNREMGDDVDKGRTDKI